MCTLESDACLSYHSPAERTVLGCQLGPACTSQGRGRHSQTQPESIQACNSVPFDSPHSSDFSQAEIAWKGGKGDKMTEKGWNPTRWVTWYSTKRKWTGRQKQKRSSEWAQSLICILFVLNENPRVIPIHIHSKAAQTPRWLETSETSACLTPNTKQSHMTEERKKKTTTGSQSAGLLLTSEMEHWREQTAPMWDTEQRNVWLFTHIYWEVLCLCWFIKNRTMAYKGNLTPVCPVLQQHTVVRGVRP